MTPEKTAVADLGNSTLKIAIFSGSALRALRRFPWRDHPAALARAARWLNAAGIAELHLISVNPETTRLLARALSKRRIRLSPIPRRLPAGIRSRYDLLKIGMDRLSNIVAARLLYKQKNLVVFDSGTALTCDIIEGGTHTGGFIGAGLYTLLSALHHRTGQLPRMVGGKSRPPARPGRSTIPAMRGGAWLEFSGYAEAALRLAGRKSGRRHQVVVTGRGPDPFGRTLRPRIRDPLLTLKGAALILEDWNRRQRKTAPQTGAVH